MHIWRGLAARFESWTARDTESSAAWLSLPTAEIGAPWAVRQVAPVEAEQDVEGDVAESKDAPRDGLA